MLYIINGKPYIRVANYYKPVKVEKKGNEYNVTPINSSDITNRITVEEVKAKGITVTSVTPEAYISNNTAKSKNNIDNM